MEPTNSNGIPRLGVRELRSDLATQVRRAGTGERLIVTVDGTPVAQLGPIYPDAQPGVESLAAAGLLRLPLRSDHPGAPTDLPLLPIDANPDRILGELRGDPPRRR
jgi:antitoxin (DNA-binding transcriptional repressor) of toxin-antitoxin stability system